MFCIVLFGIVLYRYYGKGGGGGGGGYYNQGHDSDDIRLYVSESEYIRMLQNVLRNATRTFLISLEAEAKVVEAVEATDGNCLLQRLLLHVTSRR